MAPLLDPFCDPWMGDLPPQLWFLRAVPASVAFSVVLMAVQGRFGLIFGAPRCAFLCVFGSVLPALRGFLWLTRAQAMDSETLNFFVPARERVKPYFCVVCEPLFRKLLGCRSDVCFCFQIIFL